MTSRSEESTTIHDEIKAASSQPKHSSYLETVLSHVPSAVDMPPAFKPAHFVYPVAAKECDVPEVTKTDPLSRPTLPTMDDFACRTFSIDCNLCGKSVVNEHYHCSICELGDYDLCLSCVNNGATCKGEDHWLIKRYFKNGRVCPSTTETLAPKKEKSLMEEKHVSKLVAPTTIPAPAQESEERTCNSCISRKCLTRIYSIELTCHRTSSHLFRHLQRLPRLRSLRPMLRAWRAWPSSCPRFRACNWQFSFVVCCNPRALPGWSRFTPRRSLRWLRQGTFSDD